MKKRNLKFLLALVAALALVFAAGCDNSGENASTGSYTSTYSDSKWKYTVEENQDASINGPHKPALGDKLSTICTLKSVTLEFQETSTDCNISVEYIACHYANGNVHNSHGDYTGTSAKTDTATYVATDNGVVVTLGSNELTFELEDESTLKLASVTSGASYTIGGDFDIFNIEGGLDCGVNYTRFYKTN